MSTVTFDVVRASTKYVVDENGDLSQVAANTPAFEYNVDGTYKGMLVEEERENMSLQSEDLDNATYWNTAYTTIAGDTETDPKGGTNSFLLSETTDNGSHYIVTTIANRVSIASGETWTQSIFVKKGDGANAPDIIQLTNGVPAFSGSQYANFDISVGGGTSGTVTASNGGTAEIRYYGNGWYRISWTSTSISAGDAYVLLAFTNNNPTATRATALSYAGQTDANVFIWGAQLEEGAHASSYIPTTITSVTRNKDDISNTSASTYIATAGTIYAEVQIDNILNESQWIIYARSTTDPAENYIYMFLSSSGNFGYRLEASNVVQGSHDETATTGNHKLAIVYTTGDIRYYLDGVQVGADANSFTFAQTLSEIYIGKTPLAISAHFNNWIRAFAFYKRALTDTEAIALTS